ncbi:MAG: GNAT family N-acetyltransferase [Bacteroidales bacterium]|jgi:GNAT superfamily N-acetyltransferase|nr:GNAT family N-acetyltransferase [Bacteroidales bacterium]
MKIVRLTQEHTFKPFDCGESDLNDFLLNDAKLYAQGLVAVTYIIEDDDMTVAFFSLSNDRISLSESDNATWRRIRSAFPHRKHRSDYPAVKIGRLGVNVHAQHHHIGTDILNFVKQTFITNNRTGCCFITVDALYSAVQFYENNGFRPLRKKNNGDTVPMYYDLTQLI